MNMEQLMRTTPSKTDRKCENVISGSPRLYKTPVKQHEVRSKHTAYQSNTGCFTVLPSHITPPSGLMKFIGRNPFEHDLTNRLHLSMISPSVFKKTSSPSHSSAAFAWSIDELAVMQPAKIEEFPVQQIHNMDPEIEGKAQAAIDKFFNGSHIIPSPWETKKKENRIEIDINTPVKASNDSSSESSKSKKDGWTQTILSLPPKLMPEVEEALKPFFTFTQDQNVENDDANSSNNSLRRKLFFNHDDYLENDEEISICISPVKMNESLVLSCNPPPNGMLIYGTPLKQCSQKTDRIHGTPVVISENLSSPNISPIHSTLNTVSESVKSRSRSVAKLDFSTDISMEQSVLQNKEYPNDYSLDASSPKEEIKQLGRTFDEPIDMDFNCMSVQSNISMKEDIMPTNSTSVENTMKTGVTSFGKKHDNIAQAFKMLADSCKIYTNESCIFQHTNAFLGSSDQQSVSNSAQDTGYQTYSMSSTSNITDSYNCTPTKQRVQLGNHILLPGEELRLSDWKDNLKNICSSTPSKSNREKENYVL